VSGRLVEGVTGLVDLFMVVEDESHSSFDDITPVWALTRSARERRQRPIEIGVGSEGDELDRVAVHLLSPVGYRPELPNL